jgi:hypothetical protein
MAFPAAAKARWLPRLPRKLDMAAECLDHKNMDQAISFDKDRAIYEHDRLLRTQGLDSFDALIYIKELPLTLRQGLSQIPKSGQ